MAYLYEFSILCHWPNFPHYLLLPSWVKIRVYVIHAMSDAFVSQKEKPATEPQLVILKGMWSPLQDGTKSWILKSTSYHRCTRSTATCRTIFLGGGGDLKTKTAEWLPHIGQRKKKKIHNETNRRGWNEPHPWGGDPQSEGKSQPWAFSWGVKNLNPTSCTWLLRAAPKRQVPKMSSFERQWGFHSQDPP